MLSESITLLDANMPNLDASAIGALESVEVAVAFSVLDLVEPHFAIALRTGQRQFLRRGGWWCRVFYLHWTINVSQRPHWHLKVR